MTETEFIQSLKDASICGGKIYPQKALDSDDYPYCVYSVIRISLTKNIERSHGKRNRFLFTSWHETYLDAQTTLALFDSTIGTQQTAYSESGAIIDIDPSTNKWRLTNNDWYVIEE